MARVLKRLDADVLALYPSGGELGELLQRLLDQEGVSARTISLVEETREDFTVFEQTTGLQYRFVLPGPHLRENEWKSCLELLNGLDRPPRFVVGSGSLPPGVPDDFYGRVAEIAKRGGSKIVVDSTGQPLRAALDAGVYLVKPNLNEFKTLMGAALESQSDLIKGCRLLIEAGHAEIVALTLGDQGALLVTRELALRGPALPITPVSVVGAGDSFLGAMIWSLASGHAIDAAFRCGIAAGSAALLAPGTELSRQADIERLIKDVQVQQL